jgi:hypothetical protein
VFVIVLEAEDIPASPSAYFAILLSARLREAGMHIYKQPASNIDFSGKDACIMQLVVYSNYMDLFRQPRGGGLELKQLASGPWRRRSLGGKRRRLFTRENATSFYLQPVVQ